MLVPTTDSRLSPYRWLVLAAATLLQAAAAFVTQGIAVLAGFLQKDLHLSTTEVGLLIAASSVAPLLTLLFVGDLLDRKPERHIIGVGILIMAADSAPANSVGLALGTAMTVNQVAIVVTPPVLGMIHDATANYDAVWTTLIGWIGLTFLLTYLQDRKHSLQSSEAL